MEAVSRTSTELRLELKGARRQRLAAAVFLGAGILVALLLGWRTRLRCFPWSPPPSSSLFFFLIILYYLLFKLFLFFQITDFG
jgi:hypothetical protein